MSRGLQYSASMPVHYAHAPRSKVPEPALPTLPHLWALAQCQDLSEVRDGLLAQNLRIPNVAPHHLVEGVTALAFVDVPRNFLGQLDNLATHSILRVDDSFVDGVYGERDLPRARAIAGGRRFWVRHPSIQRQVE